jgi:hypothetical protein
VPSFSGLLASVPDCGINVRSCCLNILPAVAARFNAPELPGTEEGAALDEMPALFVINGHLPVHPAPGPGSGRRLAASSGANHHHCRLRLTAILL